MSIEDACGPLEEFLKVEPRINRPGGLIGYLERGMGNRVSPTLIAAALEELAAEGKVELRKENDVYGGVYYLGEVPASTKLHEKVDAQEASSEASKVVIDLNTALVTLRQFADSEGKVSTSSCARLILEKLTCTQDYAVKLNRTLGRLKLRRSVNRGGGAYDHYVDVSNAVVTEAMYRESVASSVVSVPAKKASQSLPPLPDAQEPSKEEPTPMEVADHLAGIIAGLEGEVETLKGENTALKKENSNLKAKLTDQSISPQVKRVLERFPLEQPS